MKKFPAIRLRGDKTRAADFIRRGRTELQRTKNLMAEMGVPVYTRTAELDDCVIKTVVIGQEEIIYITCPLPEPPVDVVEEEEEEREFFDCPPGFIVYKNQFAGDGRLQSNGYLLVYDRQTQRWKQEREGEDERKHSGNCAWWHLAEHIDTYKSENQEYLNECDLVSWVGDTTPHHYTSIAPPLTSTDLLSNEAYRSIYGGSVYFQGYEIPFITSPFSSSFVCGAALLHDDGEEEEDIPDDYIYALYGTPKSSSQRTLTPRVDSLSVYRRKWIPESNYEGVTSAPIEFIGLIRLGDIGSVVPGGINDDGSGYEIDAKAAYVDERGHAYLMANCHIEQGLFDSQTGMGDGSASGSIQIAHLFSIDLKTAEVVGYQRSYNAGLVAYTQYSNTSTANSTQVKLKKSETSDYYYSAAIPALSGYSVLSQKSWYASKQGMVLQAMSGGLEHLYLYYTQYHGSGTSQEKYRVATIGDKRDIHFAGYDPSETPGSFYQRISTVPLYSWGIEQDQFITNRCWSADLIITRVDQYSLDGRPVQEGEVFRDTVSKATRTPLVPERDSMGVANSGFGDMKWGKTFNDPPHPILWRQGPCAGLGTLQFDDYMPALFNEESGTCDYGTITYTGYPWWSWNTPRGEGEVRGTILMTVTTRDYCFLHPIIPHRGYVETTSNFTWTITNEPQSSLNGHSGVRSHAQVDQTAKYIFDGEVKLTEDSSYTPSIRYDYPHVGWVDTNPQVPNRMTCGYGITNSDLKTLDTSRILYYPAHGQVNHGFCEVSGALETYPNHIPTSTTAPLYIEGHPLACETTTKYTYPTFTLRNSQWYTRITVALHHRGLIDTIPEDEYPYIVQYTHPLELSPTSKDAFDPTPGAPSQETEFLSNVLTGSKIQKLTKEDGPDKGFLPDFGVI